MYHWMGCFLVMGKRRGKEEPTEIPTKVVAFSTGLLILLVVVFDSTTDPYY